MSAEGCVRGCVQRGVHFATCPDYGTEGGACTGCAPSARRGAGQLCDRCYGKLRRGLEASPDVLAMLRSAADPLKAAVYDREPIAASRGLDVPAPVSPDLIDAAADITHTLSEWAKYAAALVGVETYGQRLTAGESSYTAYQVALALAGAILRQLDAIAATDDVVALYDQVLSRELPERPGFWTIAGALGKWPLENRAKPTDRPCPECGLRAVLVMPPRHRHALLWLACKSCGWRRNDTDDDGLWAAAFGYHADTTERDDTMPHTHDPATLTINLDAAFAAGVAELVANPLPDDAGPYDAFGAFLIAATPSLGEAFADCADAVAAECRKNYANGDLLAYGARLVASAIREAIAAGVQPDPAASAEAEAAEGEASEGEAVVPA